jgi:hypothetical protein
MSEDQFEQIFEHEFEEAVHESFQLAPPIPFFTIKQSWSTISKHIEEQN